MPNVNDMFPSKYLKAADCDAGDIVLTIRSIASEKIGDDDKWIVFFDEDDRGLALNITNTNTIVKLHGSETDDWIGKQITLFAAEVQYKADMVPAIRIRSKPPVRRATTRPNGATPSPAPTQQPQRGNGNAAPRGQVPAQQQAARRALAPQHQQPDDDPNPEEDIDMSIPF